MNPKVAVSSAQTKLQSRPKHADISTASFEKGLTFERVFTKKGENPLDGIEYAYRESKIAEPDGTVVFGMDDVEVPESWSQLATDIVVSKYFRKAGVPDTGHEVSARQVVYRVAHTIAEAGRKWGYFKDEAEAGVFEDELTYMLITQRGAFNSPVWFNCGLWHEYGVTGHSGNWATNPGEATKQIDNAYERPQCSACFIQEAKDDLMSIFELVKNEARLFKYGSGTGSNFSAIRGRQEMLSGGGTSSGLMSFLDVFDRGAGATKSGGTTRRAAKMVILDMDHPEIVDFINWKVREEKKVAALVAAGYSSDFNGEAYKTVGGQNSNNSVRVTDEFMEAVKNKKEWSTTFRTTGEVCDTYQAEDLFDQIAHAAWACADPGLQYDSTINKWHTCKNTNRINGSNPCSEYMFLDNTACNLASINLVKFLNEDSTFQTERFRHACQIFFTAQEILVDLSSYPTEEIARNSHDYRPLGLGYANLGALLMIKGIPYDSDKGRAIAGALTAILCGEGYLTSAKMSAHLGSFKGYKKNADSMIEVMKMHREHAYKIDPTQCEPDILQHAQDVWDDVVTYGEQYGYRNAQATVLAPTGTIGLLMDCDTTGVEPDFAIVKWKKLAGGGYFKIVNQSIPRALKNLEYSEQEIDDIIRYALGAGSLEGAPHLNEDVFKKLELNDEQLAVVKAHVEKVKNFDEFVPHLNTKTLKKILSKEQINDITLYVNGAETLEGAPHLKDEHLPVFDCANTCGIGKRFIAPMGHVRMMAAAQPFLSGAISKTVNLPHEATEEDIKEIYFEGWKLGLKAVALYRDGCKLSQPLNKSASESKEEVVEVEKTGETVVGPTLQHGTRIPMPKRRNGITVEATVGGQKMFLRTGEYGDGKVGEIFVDVFKEGASYRSLLNCFAVSISLGLQHGVPLDKYVESFTFTRFEPSGMTNHPNIKTSTSMVDFIFRVLGMEYLGRTDFVHVKPETTQVDVTQTRKIQEAVKKEQTVSAESESFEQGTIGLETSGEAAAQGDATIANFNQSMSAMMGDAPICTCGHVTVRNGSCYKCLNCGNSMGCS